MEWSPWLQPCSCQVHIGGGCKGRCRPLNRAVWCSNLMVASVLELHKDKKSCCERPEEPLPDGVWKQSQALPGSPSVLAPCLRAWCSNNSFGLAGFADCCLQNIKPHLSSFPRELLLGTHPMHWALTLTRIPVHWLGTGYRPCSPDHFGLGLGYYFFFLLPSFTQKYLLAAQ